MAIPAFWTGDRTLDLNRARVFGGWELGLVCIAAALLVEVNLFDDVVSVENDCDPRAEYWVYGRAKTLTSDVVINDSMEDVVETRVSIIVPETVRVKDEARIPGMLGPSKLKAGAEAWLAIESIALEDVVEVASGGGAIGDGMTGDSILMETVGGGGTFDGGTTGGSIPREPVELKDTGRRLEGPAGLFGIVAATSC